MLVGRVSALGWSRTRDRTREARLVRGRAQAPSGRVHAESAVYRTWLRARLTRLTRPVLAVVVVGAAVLPLLSVTGVPDRTLVSALSRLLPLDLRRLRASDIVNSGATGA